MIKPIKSETDYESALTKISHLMQLDVKRSQSQTDELEVMSVLVKEYEKINFTLPKPNPIEAIKFRIEQSGKDEQTLNKIFGDTSKRKEILSGHKKLSLSLIRKLNTMLQIPAEVLIQTY